MLLRGGPAPPAQYTGPRRLRGGPAPPVRQAASEKVSPAAARALKKTPLPWTRKEPNSSGDSTAQRSCDNVQPMVCLFIMQRRGNKPALQLFFGSRVAELSGFSATLNTLPSRCKPGPRTIKGGQAEFSSSDCVAATTSAGGTYGCANTRVCSLACPGNGNIRSASPQGQLPG